MCGQPEHYTQSHALLQTQFPGHGFKNDRKTERNVDSQATWVVYVLGLFFDMLSMGVFPTSHWQISGRLVQELNVCTVPLITGLYLHYIQVNRMESKTFTDITQVYR